MRTLFVGGLPSSASEELLRTLFTRFGTIADARVATRDDTGECRGFGFVTFEEDRDAVKARTELNGSTHEGIELRVDLAK